MRLGLLIDSVLLFWDSRGSSDFRVFSWPLWGGYDEGFGRCRGLVRADDHCFVAVFVLSVSSHLMQSTIAVGLQRFQQMQVFLELEVLEALLKKLDVALESSFDENVVHHSLIALELHQLRHLF